VWPVRRLFGGGDHHGAGAVGLEAVVEQAQRRADHPRGEIVVHRQRPVVHLGIRVGVGPFPAGQGDGAELSLVGAELDHVPAGQHGEHLARGGEAVGNEELVEGPPAADAGGTARPFPEPGAGASVERPEDDDGRGLPAENGSHRLADLTAGRRPAGTRRAPVGEIRQAEGGGQVVVGHPVHLGAHNSVDVVGCHPGIGDGGQRGLGGQAQRAAAGPGVERGGADAADGAAVPMVRHRTAPPVLNRTMSSQS
jgi:hypothetical protein